MRLQSLFAFVRAAAAALIPQSQSQVSCDRARARSRTITLTAPPPLRQHTADNDDAYAGKMMWLISSFGANREYTNGAVDDMSVNIVFPVRGAAFCVFEQSRACGVVVIISSTNTQRRVRVSAHIS